MLNDVGAPLLGTVLTMMPTRGAGAYSYNYYYYGGSYGDDRPSVSIDDREPTAQAAEPEADTADTKNTTEISRD
jgi:receptor protein-tyrosine kinase